MRRGDTDSLDAGDLSRDGGHQQRGGQRVTSGWEYGAHGFERPDDVAQAAAIGKLNPILAGELDLGVFADILGSSFERRAKFR